jgi:hypothetical protein
MGADDHPGASGKPNCLAHDARIPCVEAACDVRGGDRLDEQLIASSLIHTERLADIGVQVDP